MQENNNEVEEIKKNSETSNNVKNRIVPSYLKKEEKKDIKEKSKKNILPKSKISLVIILVVIIFVISLLLFFGIKLFGNKIEVSEYSKKCQIYGYEELYNSKDATDNEKITKLEALKIIIAAVYNDSNLYNIYQTLSTDVEITEENSDELWLEFARELNLTNENIEEMRKNITKIEYINYLGQAKSKIMEKALDNIKAVDFADLDKYKNEEQNALKDMVSNGIIENSTSKFKGNQKINKDEFNEILIKYVEKYNLITLNGLKINISEEKKPSNKEEYPYTLSSIKKDIYEIEFYNKGKEKYISPVELFKKEKSLYANIKEVVEGYLNTIINIDYKIINAEELEDSLNTYQYYIASKNLIEEYVKYVKANEIVIKGNATVALPAVYYDGVFYRARAIVNYSVQSSNNLKDILYFDARANTTEYKLGESTIYVDIPLMKLKDYDYFMVMPTSLNNCISGKVKLVM